MIVLPTERIRRFVVRLQRGEDLVESLVRLAAEHQLAAASVRGSGTLQWADLVHHDTVARKPGPPRRIDAPLELLSLDAFVSRAEGGVPHVRAHALLSRESDAGLQVVGGMLRAGAVHSVELVVEAFDDLALERQPDRETGLLLWSGDGVASSPPSAARAAAVPPRAAAAPQSSWAAAVEASAQASSAAAPRAQPATSKRPQMPPERHVEPQFDAPPLPDKRRPDDSDLFDEPTLVAGDYIDHKQFGLCKVEGEDSEGAMIVRLPSGVRKSLRLDYLRVLPARMDGERRIYPLEPRRR